jgi:glycerophosphoryl diester phosphodiesterase
MTDPISVTRDGHRTFLKWHRARRRASDPVFTGRRILEGMALGASVEVDLVVHGGHGFAVLHDHTSIRRETTGLGSARSHSAAQVRALQLRGNDGAPIADHVMLLEDLCALLEKSPPHPTALLQLDYKEDLAALDAETIANFARSTAPVARNMIVSGGDAEAIRTLTAAVPGMLKGYDPSDDLQEGVAYSAADLQRFVDDAIATAPDADFIYLYWQIVTLAADAGFDIVGAFHKHGKRIDAWTINRIDDASVAAVNRLLAAKVDQITTDDPEGLIARLEPQHA